MLFLETFSYVSEFCFFFPFSVPLIEFIVVSYFYFSFV